MARQRMVTRTIMETVATCMRVNTITSEVKIENLALPNVSEKDALKYAQKHFDCDGVVTVAVQSIDVREVLYGMPEVEFIQLAKVLPPRGTKEEEMDNE